MIAQRELVPDSYRRLASVDLCRPELQRLHCLWRELRGDRRMPARGDFDPAAIPDLLPDLFLVDVLAGASPERRYRVRLMGTAQARYHGVDWTGSFVHQMIDRLSADRFCAVGDQILARRDPWMSTGRLYWMPSRPYHEFETILVPLSDDGETVNMILGLTRFF